MAKTSTLMLWRVPANVDGEWSAGRPLRMQLAQKYQMLSGTVEFRGQEYPNATGRLDGDRVHLCFARHDNGRCRVGALGQLLNGVLRMLVDGDGRQQAMLVMRRQR